MRITEYNTFHNSEYTYRVPASRIISRKTAQRAARALCGISGCTCGWSPASQQEPPTIEGAPDLRAGFEEQPDGSIKVVVDRWDDECGWMPETWPGFGAKRTGEARGAR
jgi:hypothetical protein